MKKLIEIDKSDFPFIFFRTTAIEPTMENFKAFLKEADEIIDGDNIDMMFIMDLSAGKALPSEIRIEQGNWNKRTAAKVKEKVRGLVFINKSVIMTFMMKGIFLIQKPAVPYIVVRDIEEARTWINEKMVLKIV